MWASSIFTFRLILILVVFDCIVASCSAPLATVSSSTNIAKNLVDLQKRNVEEVTAAFQRTTSVYYGYTRNGPPADFLSSVFSGSNNIATFTPKLKAVETGPALHSSYMNIIKLWLNGITGPAHYSNSRVEVFFSSKNTAEIFTCIQITGWSTPTQETIEGMTIPTNSTGIGAYTFVNKKGAWLLRQDSATISRSLVPKGEKVPPSC